ncbi:glycoprotein [mulberry vein banding-associated virus]|uniref:Envelopment polyprotein n=1 Tax=mulberry vein banding-associated virus TaxID=3071209 RepID=A0A0C5H8S7_9VIRU|nr:glycoprotein [Mulberry vein banding virus]AJP16834.2 glycoprotein [mulberry vein banding-associated virus]
MKKYYLPSYCLGLVLLFLVSEVYLINQMEHDVQVKRFQSRYKADDPDDLVEIEEPTESIVHETRFQKKKKLSRILRDDEATTQSSASKLDCDKFEKRYCLIKGVSDFNAHYQLDNGEEIISCISNSASIFEIYQYEKEFKKIKFKDFLVVPVLKLENKKVLEVGTKFFFVDKSNNPVNIDPKVNLKSPTVSKLSVRLSGDCKINQVSMSTPYQIKLRSEENIGVLVKNVKDPKSGNVKTIFGDSTINFQPEELDGNHFLLCGDKSSLIMKVDVAVRNCVSKYSDEPKKIFFCTNFSYFKWIFVFLMVAFPISWLVWKTKNALSIWYDIVGIVTYPILWILNWFWPYFPFKCRICGCISFLTHTCTEKCVCNQSEASKDHTSECYLFSRDKKDWNELTLLQQFQFTINTKISTNFLVFVTKMIIASILISYIPSSIALQQSNLCVEKCYYNLNLDSLTTDRFGLSKNNFETCECSIGNVITETIYREGIPVSRATSLNDCIVGSDTCMVSDNQAQNLFACRNGCNSLNSIKNIPDTKFSKFYKGKSFRGNLTSLKIANRLREGYMDSPTESKILEEESTREYKFYSSLKVDDIPPENLMPRQSLVFSTEVDGKYRYLLEMDIKASTGSVYLLNDDASHSPMEFMVYVKSVGVEYDIRYKYSTAKIDTTVSDYLVTCTGKCADCIKQKPKVGVLDFCVTPTSWWGCEELGCLAINEGAICGHCTNIYDLSSLINIYQVIESHVTAEICVKSLDGYSCKKHSDRSPIQTDHYQLDMSIDLHNDYMSTDKLFAVNKQQKVLTGNIADLGDFAGSSFGHPQITVDGVPLAVPAALTQNDFSWSCSAVGEKKINIRQCGLYTYSMVYVLSPSKDNSHLQEDKNKLYMEKDFLVGKLKMVIDMPKEMFKKVPTKPVLSETKMTCSGCTQCAVGIDCNITYTSDTTFSSRIMMDSCSFKSDQLGTFLGPNEKTIKAYCSESIVDKSLKFIPEDQEDLTVDIQVDEFVQVDQDTIIHFDDKSAHDENKHHSDTSISSLWDWVKAPFNWVASFFGSFFDLIRIILVVLAICVGIYILNCIFKLSKTYYIDKRRQRMEDAVESIESSVLLTNYTGLDQTRKRKSPPKGYEFSLEV